MQKSYFKMLLLTHLLLKQICKVLLKIIANSLRLSKMILTVLLIIKHLSISHLQLLGSMIVKNIKEYLSIRNCY